MKQEYSSGVIVFHRDSNNHIQFLMVQGYGNYWGFPKGRYEPNETRLDTALRELQEETQISDITIIPDLHYEETYIIKKRFKKPPVEKHVTYFVGETTQKQATRQRSEIKQLGWFDLEYAKDLVVPDKKAILDAVYQKINNS